jgi:uncharacterized protein YjiS (DUF1127 family)
MTDHSLPRATGLGVTEVFSGLREFVSHWLKRQRLYRLQELDDRMLDDIGLVREEIEASLNLPLAIDPIWDLNRRAQQRRVRGTRFR